MPEILLGPAQDEEDGLFCAVLDIGPFETIHEAEEACIRISELVWVLQTAGEA
jgi:hypothetical protein